MASTMEDFQRFDALIPNGFPVVLVDRIFDVKKYPSVCVSNFQPIYRSVCRLAGRGRQRIGIIGGLPRLSSTKERISAYREAMQDCGLPVEESMIRYKTAEEHDTQHCLDELLEQKCDAIVICRTSLAADALVYVHKRGIRLPDNLELVTFLDYDSSLNQIYAGQMDCIVQPVEELGRVAGEQILARIENPDAPVFEKVLTSAYQPSGKTFFSFSGKMTGNSIDPAYLQRIDGVTSDSVFQSQSRYLLLSAYFRREKWSLKADRFSPIHKTQVTRSLWHRLLPLPLVWLITMRMFRIWR